MIIQPCPSCDSTNIKVEDENSWRNIGYPCALYCNRCKIRAPAACGLNGAIENWNNLRYKRSVDADADTDADTEQQENS